jgi:hypothetical protein
MCDVTPIILIPATPLKRRLAESSDASRDKPCRATPGWPGAARGSTAGAPLNALQPTVMRVREHENIQMSAGRVEGTIRERSDS